MRKFTEAEIKTIGGLSPAERAFPDRQLDEMMDLYLKAIPQFRECLRGNGSAKRWLESARRACRALREANSETTLGQLLRKGIQAEALNWYEVSARVWGEYCLTAGSTTVAEYYAPLYHTELPNVVDRGGRFPEAGVTGEDSNIRNIVFGQIVGFGRILFDDDQTGQIQGYSKKLGDGMGILESVWASSRLLGPARTYANVTVPASGYSTTDINGTAVTTPFSATLYGSASGNRPTTYAQLGMGTLSYAYIQSLNAVDPMQNIIVSTPDRLVTGNMESLKADILLQPGPYPAIVGQSNLTTPAVLAGATSAAGATQGALTGFPGGWGSPNPFAGMGWKHVTERYLPPWACLLGQAGKGIIFQQRDPLEIIEESKNSGSYFDFDSIRYRSRERFNVDWVGGGSRFWFCLNDGTVTGDL